MQGRVYTVVFDAVAITAAQDAFEITPADDKPIEIMRIVMGQTSDSGDAQDEQVQLRVIRGSTTSGSGGTGPTPQPLSPVDAAAGFTAEVNNTTQASSGTAVTLVATAWNVRGGCDLPFYEDERPRASQANTTIRITLSAPSDSLTVSATIWVRELV